MFPLFLSAGVESHLRAGARRGAAVRLGVRGPVHGPAFGHHHLFQTRAAHAHQAEGGQGLWWGVWKSGRALFIKCLIFGFVSRRRLCINL